MSTRLSNAIACVVTSVWAASFLADVFVRDYDPSPFIHMTMLGVGGAAFGRSFVNGMKGG